MLCSKCGSPCTDKFCEHCGAPVGPELPKEKQRALLGFRSGKSWKKALSIVYLVICAIVFLYVVFSGKAGKITTYDFVIQKISDWILLLSMLCPYLFLSNTKFRNKLPLFKKHKCLPSAFGLFIIIFFLIILYGSVQSFHSQEYQADMDNHAYVEADSKEASCEEDGFVELRCDYCGALETKIIPATGHIPAESDICSVCGVQIITPATTAPQPSETEKETVSTTEPPTAPTSEPTSEPTSAPTSTPTSAPTSEPTLPELSEEEKALLEKQAYISGCETPAYKDVARQPDAYKGKAVCFKGEVAQVTESFFGNRVTYLIAVTPGEFGIWSDPIYVTYSLPNGAPKILEDDIVMLYGECKGDQTYLTILGAVNTIPYIEAKYIDILEAE